LRLLFGGIRNDDAAFGFFLGFDALDDYPIVERPEFSFRHGNPHLLRARLISTLALKKFEVSVP
jgi:hypothetical protein